MSLLVVLLYELQRHYSFVATGEDPFSYGYGGTAKISQNNEFKDYGVPFQLNDVVGAYLVRR